jgi:predicted membrane channel-forming protein YqfA (hemolysin III family)
MSSLSIPVLFAHHEENPSIARPRHPLVVFFHLPYAVALMFAYIVLSEKTTGQTIYFMATIGLYLSSAAYHTWKPNHFLRFIDQTMISWYVLATSIPFIYHEPWALPALAIMMSLTAINKWCQWEPDFETGSAIFFGLGAASAMIMFMFGLPAIGASVVSQTSFALIAAITFYIWKLVIYHYGKFKLIPNVWETPESGHFVLSIGVTIYPVIGLLNPV